MKELKCQKGEEYNTLRKFFRDNPQAVVVDEYIYDGGIFNPPQNRLKYTFDFREVETYLITQKFKNFTKFTIWAREETHPEGFTFFATEYSPSPSPWSGLAANREPKHGIKSLLTQMRNRKDETK